MIDVPIFLANPHPSPWDSFYSVPFTNKLTDPPLKFIHGKHSRINIHETNSNLRFNYNMNMDYVQSLNTNSSHVLLCTIDSESLWNTLIFPSAMTERFYLDRS